MPKKSKAWSTRFTYSGTTRCNGIARNDQTDAKTTTRPTQTAARCFHFGMTCSDDTQRSSHPQISTLVSYVTLARMMAVPARFPYRLMRGVLIAAGVLYCSLLLELVAGYPLNVHDSFLSELGALDQQTSPYARALDLGSGVLLLLA